MAQIAVFKNDDLLSVHTLTADASAPFDIGRAETCRLQLPDDKASRRHALFFVQPGGQWAIRDLGSSNGTFVNGERIIERALKPNDVVQIGQIRIKFIANSEADGVADSPDDAASFKTVLLKGYDYGSALKTTSETRARAALNALISVSKFVNAFLNRTDTKGSRDDSDQLLMNVAEVLRIALAADRATALRVSGNQKIIPVGSTADRDDSHPMSRSIARAALRQNAAVATETLADNRFKSAQSVQDQAIASAVCVPVFINGSARYLIYCDRIGLSAKPFDADDIDILSTAALLLTAPLAADMERAALIAENRRLKSEPGASDEIIGDSGAIQSVREFIRRVAPSDAIVLITGESGVGKEFVARAIHTGSTRARAPLETVNCAAMTESLIESELFGHTKGAFTGASSERIGRFEAADGGTLFLDEIGELPVTLQAKLLRVLENGEFSRVGETRVRRTDVRVIAATNRDLESSVASGSFRNDLFFRLNVLRLAVPSLRERGTDVLLLAANFLKRAGQRMGRPDMRFAPDAESLLLAYDWKGNVRELRNLAERLAVLASDDLIGPDDLPPELTRRDRNASPAVSWVTGDEPATETLEAMERRCIQRALDAAGGNKKKAADILGIDRSTLYAKLKQDKS
ncbi:MAG: sigma 54-interacting transcriptional regulator [Planctomycetota bacterium]